MVVGDVGNLGFPSSSSQSSRSLPAFFPTLPSVLRDLYGRRTRDGGSSGLRETPLRSLRRLSTPAGLLQTREALVAAHVTRGPRSTVVVSIRWVKGEGVAREGEGQGGGSEGSVAQGGAPGRPYPRMGRGGGRVGEVRRGSTSRSGCDSGSAGSCGKCRRPGTVTRGEGTGARRGRVGRVDGPGPGLFVR